MKNWFGKLKHPILLLLLFMTALCRGIDVVRTLAHPAIRRRVMAVAISACMVVTMLPLQAFAAKSTQNVGGLCEHHPVHTAECGYTEGIAGTPCGHEHTEDCYIEVTDCTHEHGVDCYNADAEIATDSEAKDPVKCEHRCSEETGCITQELKCLHERGKHDDTCGYTTETEGMPCAYVCEICYSAEKDAELQLMEANALKATVSDKGWELNNGELTISSTAGMDDWANNGLTANRDKITTVTIDEGVTTIQSKAFQNCSALTDVTAPGATSIEQQAFAGCSKLTNASFPAATTIGQSAFAGCYVFTKLTLGATPPTVGTEAFADYNRSQQLKLVDAGGTALSGDALTTAQGLYRIAEDGDIQDNYWYGWSISNKQWEIDTDGNLTIFNAKGMTDWVDNGLTDNTDNVKIVTIAPSVKDIVKDAFKGCSLLTNVTATGATTIYANAFSGCTALESASFPVATGISQNAFWGCTALESASFPVATTISKNAFSGCTALATLTLGATPPSSVSELAFDNCPSVRALNLVNVNGETLTGEALTAAQVAYRAKADGNTMDYFWYGWKIADLGWEIDVDGSLTISNATGMESWVKDGWDANKDNVKIVIIAPSVTEIPKHAFDRCKSLTNVTAPDVKSIEEYAFRECAALKSANFPVVESIGEYAFFNCKSLTDVTAPDAKNIIQDAFNGCTALTSIEFPVVETIGPFSFKGCTALKSASFPAAKSIEDYAFFGCTELTSASFPAVTTIEYAALYDCKKLTTLSLPAAPPSVGAYVFSLDVPNRALKFVNPDGSILTGDALAAAQANYKKDTGDGNSTDNLWYRWMLEGTTVPSVEVTPKTANVQKGTTQQFTATVTGANNPAQTVTWKVTGGKAGTSISTGGLLTVASDETAASLTVTATSTVDTTISGTATATVTNTGGGSSGGGSSSGNSGGGSSSGGSGGGGSTTKPSTPNQSNPSMGESTVTAPVDGNGNASVTVTDKTINDAIKEAKKNAAQDQPISVSIKVETDKDATQITAALPKTVLETMISNKVDAVKITTGTITMSFGQTAIQQITGQAKADVAITAAKSDTSKLTGDAKALIGSRPMFDFNVTYGSGEKITDFGGDAVSIAIPYTFGKGEAPGNLCAIYVDGDGKATKITNSSYDADQQTVIFTTSHFSQYGIGYQASYNFTDISNHWAKTNIEFVANRGLMSGTNNTTFAPNDSMTRGMFVTALGRLAGVDANSYKNSKFTDVATTAYYAPYVNWAAEKGITSGTTATTFSPDNTVTRQEVAVFMSNYAKAMGYKVPETRVAVTFADNSSIESWAAAAVKQMQMAGILSGKSNNTFDPAGTATRGEISAMLHRYVELVIDKSTTEGWTTNDSGNAMYYKNGKALVGAHTLDGVAHTFNDYGETTR